MNKKDMLVEATMNVLQNELIKESEEEIITGNRSFFNKLTKVVLKEIQSHGDLFKPNFKDQVYVVQDYEDESGSTLEISYQPKFPTYQPGVDSIAKFLKQPIESYINTTDVNAYKQYYVCLYGDNVNPDEKNKPHKIFSNKIELNLLQK